MAATLLASAATFAAASGPGPRAATVEVWLELDEPVPSREQDPAEAARRRAQVAAQQARVRAALAQLGATEIARVRNLRNDIAVRFDASRVSELESIPGVKRVRPARSLHPPKPMP